MPSHPRDAEEVEFDEHNERELARHRITATEVLQVLCNDPTWARNKKRRAATWIAVGHTDGGRVLTIAVLYQGEGISVRPITGWDSSKQEQSKFLPKETK